jgi:diguanylate cyclase (GGDEF)-like protein/PAS domain S-box-containing protein
MPAPDRQPRLRGRALPVLSAAGGFSGVIALAFAMPAGALFLPTLAFGATVAVVLLLDRRIGRRRALPSPDAGLTDKQARAFLVDLEETGRNWFWETDQLGHIAYISQTLAGQLGLAPRTLIGRPFVDLVAQGEPDTAEDGLRTLNCHFASRSAFSELAVQAAGSGEERWWSISGRPMATPLGQFLGFRGSGADLTEIRRSHAEITRLAQFDSLTGLANRAQMLATLEQALAAQHGAPGDAALLLLDLDRFKEVNDTMGHPAGDALLRQVAQRLLRLVGNAGKVGRLGGDEFQIVLPGPRDPGELARLAGAIIQSISQPYSVDGSQVVIGVSIGIAIAPRDGANSETLIRNADLALYAAKGDGRGVFRSYAPAMHAEAEDRRRLEADLREAIGTGGLHIEYQPVVCASTERITGFESLVRWEHPVRGPISPAIFLPIAEEAGLIGAIGEWVLRTACRDAVEWPQEIRVAVNVSPVQFANAALPSLVMSALANAGLPASRLELEITENVLLADGADTDGMFAALKAIGVRLVLDDFGTGYSALGYLKSAPFDKIKIDQSFVRGAAINGSRNAAIVKSMVSLAEALGMDTTAEGAETLDELALIRSLGCSHVQGYIYGRPADRAHTLALLEQGAGRATIVPPRVDREPRTMLLRTVVLSHAGQDYTGRIRNLSPRGAMIEGLIGVPPGTTFQVDLGADQIVSALSRWSQGDRMGIEFERTIEIGGLRAPSEHAPSHIEEELRIIERQDFRRTG